MASVKRGDTWPPLRGKAEDEDGLIDFSAADYVKVILKAGATTIQGTVTPASDPDPAWITQDPDFATPDSDGFNWKYTWAATDTALVGNYSTELEVHWDDSATPPQVETVPNGDNPTLSIIQDNG